MAKKEISSELTIKDCLRLFNVSDMTFFNWRTQRTGGRPKPPEKKVAVGERHRSFFPKEKLAAWAVKHKVPMDKKVAKEFGISA